MSDVDDRLALLRAQPAWHLDPDAFEALQLKDRLVHHHFGRCPACQAEGWFLRALLGRRHHPACGACWVETPATWLGASLRSGVAHTVALVTDPITAVDQGCTSLVAGGCLYPLLGLPLLLGLLPLQATLWLLSDRPAPS